MAATPTTRRAFLSSLGTLAAGAACGGGDDGTGPSAPSEPSPTWASFTDEVNDLLTGLPATAGRIEIPGHASLEIAAGRYTVRESDQLALGQTCGEVLIDVPGCVSRITGVVVRREGLRVDLGYKEVPLDVVGDEDLYGRWMQTRPGSRILKRWDPGLYRGAVIFDRQLFRYTGMEPELFSTDYPVEPSLVESALIVAGSQISGMTGGALPDGVRLASEMPQSEWPVAPIPEGWLVYRTLSRYFERVPFSILGTGYWNDFGTVYAAAVALPPGRRTTPAEIRAKTLEAMGAYSWGSAPDAPASVGEAFGMIQYHRKIGQRAGDVPDYQD